MALLLSSRKVSEFCTPSPLTDATLDADLEIEMNPCRTDGERIAGRSQRRVLRAQSC